MEEQNISTKKLDKNKKIILTVIAVLILCVGSTLAYIIASLQDEARGNASVTSDAVDILRFEVDKDISLNPTQFNVVEGGDNLSDTAVGSAILRANSTNNNATYNYYVYFQINSNDYIYTTPEHTPEIVLTITDPEGNPVTSISGLSYVTSGGVSGFDITTKSGLYEVAELYEITSTSSLNDTIQEWTFTVSFINLDTNQAENGGKTLEAEIILSRDATDYHRVCEEGTLACNIARLYNEESPELNGLYYHNGKFIYEEKLDVCMFEGNQVSSFPSGISTSAEDCNTVYSFAGMYYDASVITSGLEEGVVEEVTWDGGTCKTTTSGATVYTDMDNNTPVSQESCSGYAAIANDTASVIMVNVGSGTMESLTTASQMIDANDNSYRYSGANPNNYVCFGSNEANCPTENLYRIIGVFNGRVKLIKADYVTSDILGVDGRDYYGSYVDSMGESSYYKGNMTQSDIAAYRWNYDTSISENGSNNWTTSELNIINLNKNYLNKFGSWADLIGETTWYVGGINQNEVSIANSYYEAERDNTDLITYYAKIGLMYQSDYGYAASPDYWINSLNSYDTVVDYNWMYLGLKEWTITPYTSSYGYLEFADYVDSRGRVNNTYAMFGFAIRPVFYLQSSVLYSSGDGSIDNPYRIEI